MVVGFSSLGSFSRRFRALVGCRPSEYQRRAAPPAIPGCIAMAWGRPASADKHADGRRS
jgi:AraC-like DNA-binding protein